MLMETRPVISPLVTGVNYMKPAVQRQLSANKQMCFPVVINTSIRCLYLLTLLPSLILLGIY